MCEHCDDPFSKKSLVDTFLEKSKSMPKEQQNIFLIQEFESVLLEINCPSEFPNGFDCEKINA